MIHNHWYVILDSKELKNKPLRVKRLNENLALWRGENGKACCIADRCCHRGVSLACGKIIEGNLECPFHGFIYDKSGRVTVIPANGKNKAVPETMKVHSYKTFEAYGLIWIWWGDESKITQETFFLKNLLIFPIQLLLIHGAYITAGQSKTSLMWCICRLFTAQPLAAALQPLFTDLS